MIAALALPLALVLAPSELAVTSDSECPGAGAITAALGALVGSTDAPGGVVHVRSQPPELIVELAGPGGEPQRRALPDGGECDARARAVAVVVASWLGGIQSGAPVRAPAAPPPPPPRVRAARPPAPSVEATSPRPSSRGLALGLGVVGGLDQVGAQAGLQLDAALERAGSDLAFRLAFAVALPRDQALGQGVARWWRPTALLTVATPLVDGATRLTLGGGALAGLLLVEGRGYDVDRSDAVLSFGATAGLRVSRRLGRTEPWAELRGQLWPFRQEVQNQQSPSGEVTSKALPLWEAHVVLGFSFQVF
jgi:hypothetical protein